MSARVRVLFIVEATTLAHLCRGLLFATFLDPAKYEITFAYCPNFRIPLPDKNIQFRTVHSISKAYFDDCIRRAVPFHDLPILKAYVEDDLKLMDQVQPHLVIGDFRFSLNISAAAKKIPFLNITNAHWNPEFPKPWVTPENPWTHRMGLPLTALIANIAGKQLFFARMLEPVNYLRHMHGLKPLKGFYHLHCSGDANLFCDLPLLFAAYATPPQAVFIGPVFWSYPAELPHWWSHLDPHRKTIFLNLGSTGSMEKILAGLDVFAEIPWQFIIAKAGRALSQKAFPQNVFITDFLPGDLAARRSDLVVCNGGTMSTYQAWSEGKPVIGICSNFDQYLFMHYASRCGSAMSLRSDQTDSRKLLSAIGKVMENRKFSEQAAVLKTEVKKCSSSSRFSAFLDQFVSKLKI